MTPDQSRDRIAKIEALQTAFDGRIASLDKDLLAILLEHADSILANPKTLSRILGKFDKDYKVPALQQFGLDILTITELNKAYFNGAVGSVAGGVKVSQSLFDNVSKAVDTLLTERFGITPTGEIVSNGLFDLFSQDNTVRRQIQQFAYGQKASGIGLQQFKKNMRAFVAGDETASTPATSPKGINTRYFDTVAYDTYQQADRAAQQAFASGLNMTAFLYLGGKIASSRPFCVVRNDKCFLLSEIKLMGTSKDKYGGYKDKSTGYFSGKSNPYDPFQNAGGYACRHHWSAVSDAQALRMRLDLVQGKDGKLSVQA